MLELLKKRLPIIIFFIFVAVTVFFIKRPENGNGSISQSIPNNNVDYYMKNYTIIATNNQGVAQYWFNGSEMTHFPENLTNIEKPQITIHNPQKQIWTTKADSGQINDAQQITLDGSVQIDQVNVEHAEIQIKTEQLVISLKEKTAISDHPVDITIPNGKVNAKGMRMDFENNKVKLLSGVNAQYVIKK